MDGPGLSGCSRQLFARLCPDWRILSQTQIKVASTWPLGQPARMSTDHQPAIVLFGNNKGLRVILQISHRRQPPSHSCCGNVVFVKYAFGTGDLSVLLIPSCHLASSIMNDAPAKLQLLAFQLPEGKIVGGEETDSPSCER